MKIEGENQVPVREYRLFGDMWLERPEDHLNDQELANLRVLEPSIRRLESQENTEATKKEAQFDMEIEFKKFSDLETTKWRELGAERPAKFLLRPSGSLDSPVACHLHNPTFYVKDPYCQETDNPSSPTIHQINQAGFSSENCLLFDDICRRDRTDDVLLFYNKDIIRVHEEFMLSIRNAMAAKVEICWGRHVRERMKTLLDLAPLKLWGEFRDIELYLEMQNKTALRFVLFVAHPQFFFYHGSFTESGLRFRETQARKQDLYLTVASKLGRIERTPNFYESVHQPALYGQFDKVSRRLVAQLEADADTQLRAAFPVRYEEIESSVRIISKEPGLEQLEGVESDVQQVTLSDLIKNDISKELLIRHSQFARMSQTLDEAITQCFMGAVSLRSIVQMESTTDALSEWDNILEWDQLPEPLLSWIQHQDGLKIDQKPISSKEELIAAYNFLSPTKHDSNKLTLIQATVKVAASYILRVKKQRDLSVQDLIIPSSYPYKVIRRKCAKCGTRVLDDAFACFAKADPKKYVIWYRRNGCGDQNCRPSGLGSVNLVPMDPNQGYRMATRQALQCLRTAGWEEYLLRCTPQERSSVQQIVQTICQACKQQLYQDTKPRWTCETPSRYVILIRGCKSCSKRYSSFVPIDEKIPKITQAALSKKWKDLRAGGIEPTNYPRRPDILWSRKSHLTKVQVLEYARDMPLLKDGIKLPPSLKRKRNFNTKSRIKP